MQQPPRLDDAHVPPPAPSQVIPMEGPATNTLAMVSLAAGIAGYVIPHPFIAGIVAIITGHMARGQIRRTGESGNGLAVAGLILGYVHFALSIILVLAIVAILLGIGILGRH